jgi:hypothetical protein
MIKKIVFTLSVALYFNSSLIGQSYWFGPKGGGGLGFQNWQNSQSNALFTPNVDLFIESFSEDNTGAVYASLGYHIRGSAIRAFDFNGQLFSNQGFKFRNLVAEVGWKKYLLQERTSQPYFGFGIRGEYTVSNNLADYSRFANPFYPDKELARKWMYGVTVAGGFDYSLSDLIKGFVEISIMPDLSDQYFQPPLRNIIDPWTRQKIDLEERRIRNVTLEVKVGIKFLRKVIYE